MKFNDIIDEAIVRVQDVSTQSLISQFINYLNEMPPNSIRDVTKKVDNIITRLKTNVRRYMDFYLKNNGKIFLMKAPEGFNKSGGTGFDTSENNSKRIIIIIKNVNDKVLEHEIRHIPNRLQEAYTHIKNNTVPKDDERIKDWKGYIFHNIEIDEKISEFVSSYEISKNKYQFKFNNYKFLLMRLVDQHYGSHNKARQEKEVDEWSKDIKLKNYIIKRLIREGYPYDKMVG